MKHVVLLFFVVGLFLAAPRCRAADAPATTAPAPRSQFSQFVGANQAGADEMEIWKHIGHVRMDFYWGAVEPARGEWKQDVLDKFGKTILDNRAKGVEMLPILDFLTDWAAKKKGYSYTVNGVRYDVADVNPQNLEKRTVTVTNLKTKKSEKTEWSTGFFPPENVKDWENYVERVVSFLSKPPYNVKYFQVWNEANDEYTGFWCSTLDEYMQKIHIPAARIIQKYGGKVVYGGYPCNGNMQHYLNAIERNHAWRYIDVLDVHYFPVSSWDLLYNRVSKIRPEIGIWQTEIGFTTNPTWVPNNYPRFFHWAISHDWKPDRYRIYQFAYWSPDDPKAYGYECNFLASSRYTSHGKALLTLGSLLDSPKVKSYTDWQTKPVLRTNQDETKSSVEAFDCGKRIVLAIHLVDQNGAAIFSDWEHDGDNMHLDAPSSNLLIQLPKIKAEQIERATRVGVYGSRLPLTVTAVNGKGVELAVPLENTDKAERKDNGVGRIRTCYVSVDLKQ